jgi:hypothetical protein
MISGRFFVPEFSDGEDRATDIFRYKLLRSNTYHGIVDTYPIYVTLKTNSIEFHFQGKFVSRDEISFIFGQVPLLKIPLGRGKDVTSEEVVKVFNRELGVKWYLDGSDGELHYQLIEPDPTISKLLFSSLKSFGLSDINWSEKTSDGRLTEEIKLKFLRRMLLDFLQDFADSRVFHYSSHYFEVRGQIFDVALLEGIILKASFFLKNMQMEEEYSRIATLQSSQENARPDKLKTYLFLDSLDRWTHFITRPDTKTLFATQNELVKINEWYNPIIEPYAWFTYNDGEIMNALWHSKHFQKNPDNGNRSSQKSRIRKRSASFLISEFEMIKAIMISFSFRKFLLLGFIALTLGMAAMIFLNYIPKDIETTSYISSIWVPFGLGASLLSIPILYLGLGKMFLRSFLLYKVSNPLLNIAVRVSSFFMNVGILLLPVLGWIIWLSLKGTNILIASDWKWLILYTSAFMIFGLGCILASLLFNVSEAINILLPRLQMAVMTSWIGILGTFDLWKLSFNITIPDALIISSGIISVTAIYLFFHIRKNTHLNNLNKLLWKLMNVLVPGFLLSLSMGIMGMSFMSEKYMTQNNFFSEEYIKKNIFEINEWNYQKEKFLAEQDTILRLGRENRISQTVLLRMGKLDRETMLRDSVSNAKRLDLLQQKIDSIQFYLNVPYLFDCAPIFKLVTYDQALADKDSTNNVTHLKSDHSGLLSRQKFAYIFTYPSTPPYISWIPIKLVKDFLSTPILIMPGFLLLMSTFALFSGIFLTLLFEDKPVTEPL